MKKHSKPKELITHTSVSLKPRHKKKLLEFAEKYSISVNDLMVLLLRYINERSLNLGTKQSNVRHQSPEGGMEIVNLYVNQRDYERNIDARKYAKFSVSWLLAYAIDHFIETVMEKINESLSHGESILNNYLGLQTVLIKKTHKRIKLVSIWYPQKE